MNEPCGLNMPEESYAPSSINANPASHLYQSFSDATCEVPSLISVSPPLQSRESISDGLDRNDAESIKKSQFPDIEKCIPRWKQIFPWVCWCSEDCVLFCLHCRELLRKYFPEHLKKSNVVAITTSDKIFSVAKTLRSHHDSPHHVAAVYLFSHSSLISFVSLFNNHYKDMKHEKEIIEAVRSVFNYSELNVEGLVMTIKNIGQFIERTLVESLKGSRHFSIVADQCRGILIVRWINKGGQIGEHVFWSYLSEWSMTPLQYLRKFGIDMERLTLYIANSLCQQCKRCQNLSIMPASLPPRPPSTLSFANILWNLDFLRPLSSLINTISKLFKAYPYKFAEKFDCVDLRNLFYFSVKPIILIKIMENFDVIKTIATEIYESRSFVEALGLAMVELKCDERHKKILRLIQEVIDTVKEATTGAKISDEQIVRLNQALGSLKSWSANACFITYEHQNLEAEQKTRSDKVWEFLYFVEKFIDENQKSLYYNGRDRVVAFITICSTKALLNDDGVIDQGKLYTIFNTVFEVYVQTVKVSASGKLQVYNNVRDFHKYLLHSKTPAANCVDIMNYFYTNTFLQTEFQDAFEIFSFCGTMPFQTCQVARSLFVSFVIEQRLESSVWVRMGDDIKPWLLYLQHELSFIPTQRLITWWLTSIPNAS